MKTQEITLTPSAPPLIIGATGMDEITQNIRMIITTLAYSTPLDRGFASTGSFIDAPSPYEVARKVAELTEAIEAKEPRVRVLGISYATTPESEMQGRVYPKISFELREEVTP